jgi:hypothetical protein
MKGDRMNFSLSCQYCDAGTNVESREQAEAEGWIELEEDDGLSWTWLGICPDCRPQWDRDNLPPEPSHDGQ